MPTILKELHLLERGLIESANITIFICTNCPKAELNMLGPKGCAYLANAGLDSIIQLNLSNNTYN